VRCRLLVFDFLRSAERDKKAARREHPNPRTIVTDRLKSYPGALQDMKREGELWRFTRHRRGRWHTWSSRTTSRNKPLNGTDARPSELLDRPLELGWREAMAMLTWG
jgi:transposase-like protein